ncbi:MAG: hypothetical protein DRJ42_19105 [Deltaproteobacteria bacterium]|nr:MAG: hypothetical protein DRJ42_19105 [Deltaproteobacteria bacterium]
MDSFQSLARGASAIAFTGAVVGIATMSTLVAPTTAAAQCAEGRVANEQTQGRCCWPGQAWSAETSLCTGAPACPAGRVAQGDDCVVAAGAEQPVQAQGTAAVPVAPTGYGAQPQAQAQAQPTYQQPVQPVEPVPMRTVTTVNKGLVITGAILFGATYLPALVIGVGEEYGALAIPIVGPLVLAADKVDGSSSGAGYAYMGLTFWTLAQTAGAAMFILGMVLKREVEVRADLGGGRSVALAPYEVPGGGGLQLLGEF